MILPDMTPREKMAQMAILKPYVNVIADKVSDSQIAPLKRAGRYPAFLFLKERDIKGMGRWTVVVVADSKRDACRGRFNILAFQPFHVARSKNITNIGTGIYMYHPQQNSEPWCCEMPPHYFNRIRQRLIVPKGIVQPDMNGLIREVLRIHHHAMSVINEGEVIQKDEDGLYDIVKNPARQRQEGYDNFAAYHKEGITLGISVDRRYFLYTTFVSNALLRQSQQDMQRENVRDAYNHELARRYNPESVFIEEKIVDKIDF